MQVLVDTHIHLDAFPAPDLPAELEAAHAACIAALVVPGVVPDRWPEQLALAHAGGGVWCAPGVHPRHALVWDASCEARLAALLAAERVCAVGEIGLDATVAVDPAEQERVLRAQLRLARTAGLPVLLHCRRATDRLFRILDAEGGLPAGGILHAFSGSTETARAALRRNLLLGFGGALTWPGIRRATDALRSLPAEAIVLETDAPDMTPAPYRGARNRPVYLTLIAEQVARLRNWSPEETAQITTANACRVLGLTHF